MSKTFSGRDERLVQTKRETKQYKYDMQQFLRSGETISSGAAKIGINSDPDSNSAISGAVTVSGTVVTIPLDGSELTQDVTNYLSCLVTLSSGRKHEVIFELTVPS